jgi:hypothetical protein
MTIGVKGGAIHFEDGRSGHEPRNVCIILRLEKVEN